MLGVTWKDSVNQGMGSHTGEALERDPDYAQALAYRAWLLRGAVLLSRSIDDLRAAVELDPHSILYIHALTWSIFYRPI